MSTSELPREEALYLAGLFDGEGSINISTKHGAMKNPLFFIRVCVQMNDRSTVETFHRHFGGQLAVGRGNRCNQHAWSLRGRAAKPFLEAIAPLLRIKSAQATLALLFIDKHVFEHHTWSRHAVAESVIADRTACYERMGELNQSHWWKRRHAPADAIYGAA